MSTDPKTAGEARRMIDDYEAAHGKGKVVICTDTISSAEAAWAMRTALSKKGDDEPIRPELARNIQERFGNG